MADSCYMFRLRTFVVSWVVLFLVLCEVIVVPNIATAKTKVMTEAGFGISRLGGHDYGTNGIGVWMTGKVRVGLSDTIDQDFNGVGLIESWLSPEDLKQANDIQARLCKAAQGGPKNEVERVEPATIYSVDCALDGRIKTYQGKTYELPAELCTLVDQFYIKTRNTYMRDGRALVKLDAKVTSALRQTENFLVSVTFVNSGEYAIKMFTPDRWSTDFGDRLDVGGSRVDGTDEWDVRLAGQPLVNKAEFPDEIVTIDPQQSVTFKFMAIPTRKAPRGTYQLHAVVVTGITGEGVVATMGKVDFRSDRSKPTRATFERDYPSTSQEWNEYEARHRQDMSSFPVKPGETFAEDGFYRYVIHSQRSRFVFSGRKGEVARSYTNIVNEKGEPMDGSPHWIWEADRAVEDHCSVNDPCPRDGRWTWASNYSFRDYMGNNNRFFERRFVAGELMPELELNGTLSHYLWTWIGV